MFNWSPEEEQQDDENISHLLGDGDADIEQTGQQTDQEQPQIDDQQDPNRQGVIRDVQGAHLVYKRKTSDNTFDELWIYNIGKLQDELQIRKAIIAGTDIPTNKTTSPDGKQSYEVWATGNAELLHIIGLPQ